MESVASVAARPPPPSAPPQPLQMAAAAEEAPASSPSSPPWASLLVCGLDGSQNTIELRLGMTGLEAALAVGSFLGVTKREEFGLAFPAKKGWLDEDQSLADQGLRAADTLIFKKVPTILLLLLLLLPVSCVSEIFYCR